MNIFLIIGLLVSILINVFLLIKSINYINFIDRQAAAMEQERLEVLTVLEHMYSEMQDIDIRGSFESDDEVGVVFGDLKKITEKYKSII